MIQEMVDYRLYPKIRQIKTSQEAKDYIISIVIPSFKKENLFDDLMSLKQISFKTIDSYSNAIKSITRKYCSTSGSNFKE